MLDVMIFSVGELSQNVAQMIHSTAHVPLADIAAAVPNPGQGIAPPGSKKLETLLGWLAWMVFGLCVTGVLIVAGRMAIRHQKGEGGSHAASLVWVLTACILAASASLLVTQIIAVQG